MNDKEIFKKITEAAEQDYKPDFAGLMNRINNQTEEERRETRNEALALVPEKKQRLGKNTRRLLTAAAALLVTLGISSAFIIASLSTMSKPDTAEPIFEAADMLDAVNNFEDYEGVDIISDTTELEENATSPSDSDIGDKNDSGTETDLNEHSNKETKLVNRSVDRVGITVDLPEKAYITDRTVDEDFPLLEVYGISATQLEANYKTRGIYCNALWYDDDADITEIVITMSSDNDSKRFNNLKNLSSYNINRVKSMYLDYSSDGGTYYDVDTVETEQALFFRALGTLENAGDRSNHLQYMTIINRCRVEITLIEHFGISGDITGEEPKEVSAEHQELMEQVIASVHWNKVQNGFFSHNRGIFFYLLLALSSVAAIVVSFAGKKKDKNFQADFSEVKLNDGKINEEPEKSDTIEEEQSTEDSEKTE